MKWALFLKTPHTGAVSHREEDIGDYSFVVCAVTKVAAGKK
jgi:hypothetical protein